MLTLKVELLKNIDKENEMSKQLLKVKVFNRIKENKFDKDMEEWKKTYCHSPLPSLSMYIFVKNNGVPRRKGYVVSEGNSHKFYHTKEEVFTKEQMRVDV